MNILDTRTSYLNGEISKPDFIKKMYQLHHSKLFEYADYIKQTNIASIEILDNELVMTSRDRGVKVTCPLGDYRVAPIEGLNFLDYETTDSAMIMRLVSPDDCVVDIGANIGWYSMNLLYLSVRGIFSEFMRRVKRDSVIHPVPVQIGLDDDIHTEILGGLKPGDEVILSMEQTASATVAKTAASNPFMPKPPGANKK